MKRDIIESENVVSQVLDLMGGLESAREVIDREISEERELWEQSTGAIGRILRSHLYVEYRMTRYLQTYNPNLGDLDQARLTYSQKLSLLNKRDEKIGHLIPGVRQLNVIRNRIGHQINSSVEKSDCEVFLANKMFSNLRIQLAKPEDPSDNPIAILETFAMFAGCWFRDSRLEEAFRAVSARKGLRSD
ncbi:MAG: hypothetical protein ACKVQW_10450 [Pyrinomonadaceae bacterium]